MNADEVRNRFGLVEVQYHSLERDCLDSLAEVIKSTALYLNELLPEGRYKALTMTALEQVEDNATRAITRQP